MSQQSVPSESSKSVDRVGSARSAISGRLGPGLAARAPAPFGPGCTDASGSIEVTAPARLLQSHIGPGPQKLHPECWGAELRHCSQDSCEMRG
jgi:hypothetical protein